MTRIFISYSRVDLQFVKQLYDLLQRMRPHWHIWYDQAPHGLLGGDSWWDEIMNAIAEADIFIYVLTNEAVQSRYCQAEFEEARRLQKRIITIQARDRTKLQGDLADIQFVDMKNGVNDGTAVAQLAGALDRQASLIKKHRALWRPQTPKPEDEPTPAPRPTDAPDIDTPTLKIPIPQTEDIEIRPRNWTIYATIASVIVLILAGALITLNGGGTNGDITPTNDEPAVASINIETLSDEPTTNQNINASDARATGAAQAYATLTALVPTDTPTITLTPQDTPISLSDIQQTAQAEIFSTETAAAQTQAVIAQETQSAVVTEQFSAGSTATYIGQLSLTPPATNTSTPSHTPTATNTLRPTHTPSQTATNTPRPTNTSRPTVTKTPRPTNTPRPTATNTSRPTATRTLRPTRTSQDSVAVINVASANLRSGPGTNYNVVGSASLGTSFAIVARTADRDWYLIEREDEERAWISSGIVDISTTNASIEIVATIPPTVASSGNISNDTVSSLPITFSGTIDTPSGTSGREHYFSTSNSTLRVTFTINSFERIDDCGVMAAHLYRVNDNWRMGTGFLGGPYFNQFSDRNIFTLTETVSLDGSGNYMLHIGGSIRSMCAFQYNIRLE